MMESSSSTMQPQYYRPTQGGCCGSCKRQNKTQLTGDSSTRKRVLVASVIMNLLVYLLYITIVCIITFSVSSLGTFGLTKIILHHFIDSPFTGYGDQITTFRESSTINDFWRFSENVLIPNLYTTDLRGYSVPFLADEIEAKAGLDDGNFIAGGARFRQIRVVQDTCPIQKTLPLLSRICYPKYSESKEYKKKLYVGGGQGGDHLGKNELHGTRHSGSVTTYSANGYAVTLHKSKERTLAMLKRLKENLWITRATRAVFLEFILFNPNINVFSSVRLAWEIPATGGVTTSWDIETVKLNQYSTPFEKFEFVCEIAFICFTVYFFVIEMIICCKVGCRKYFSSGWTYVTLVIFALSCFCIVYNLKRYFTTNKIVTALSSDTQIFLDVDLLIQLEVWYKNLDAVLIFLVWVKLFKYLTFNRSLSILEEIINHGAKDFAGFGIILFAVVLSFAGLGHIVFGTQVLGFSSFGMSIYTLWGFILGKFYYNEVYHANRFFGPIFFFSFIILVFLILVSIFLAIINDSYQTVQRTIDNKDSLIIRSEDCVDAITCSSCCRRRRDNSEGFQDVKDIHIDPKEIKSHLRSWAEIIN